MRASVSKVKMIDWKIQIFYSSFPTGQCSHFKNLVRKNCDKGSGTMILKFIDSKEPLEPMLTLSLAFGDCISGGFRFRKIDVILM